MLKDEAVFLFHHFLLKCFACRYPNAVPIPLRRLSIDRIVVFDDGRHPEQLQQHIKVVHDRAQAESHCQLVRRIGPKSRFQILRC